MTAYEIMIKTNYYLIKGGKLTEAQKKNIVYYLLTARSTENQIYQFYDSLKSPNISSNTVSNMYPNFFVPPYNDGKKYKTVLNQTPQTHILSANMYELEIIRLLHLLAPDNFVVKIMVEKTLERLKDTCFGYKDDGVGECFDASLVVLRFISTVEPNDYDWIQSRIMNFNRHYHDKKRSNYSMWYFWLCLSEMPFHIAKPEIEKHKEAMIDLLSSKSMVMKSESHKMIHPVLFCIIRNVLANYPEYTYITDRQPYVMEKDGRLYFDMS